MTPAMIFVGQPEAETFETLSLLSMNQGYSLHLAASASEALELLPSLNPSAVLIDIGTPELNGVETCRTIADQMQTHVPIIALNQGNHQQRRAALSSGADLVLDEPVSWPELHNWLQAPRTQHGDPSAAGALLGQTIEDVDGTASLLSHDLKSPISVIISSLEVLLSFKEEDSLSDPTQRLLQGALHAAYRQLNLVNTLVDLPRLELGSYDLQRSEIDLAHLLHRVLEKERYTLEVKGLDLQLNIAEQPIHVSADQDLLQAVISTLIDCVMKFTVRDDTLWITLDQIDGQAVLQFTDTGRPITPGFEQDIMTRAPQWTHRQAGARTSVALGLPFVYQVAEAHGGSFTARSAENGKCTTFTFSLPALA